MNFPTPRFMIHVILLTAIIPFIPAFAAAKGENLAKIYKATLDHEEASGGRDWTLGKEDVWSLKSFDYSFENKLKIACGSSTVVFGRHGTNVVWAALIPEEPGEIKSAPGGEGEHVTSIFLRFNPSMVGKLFPSKTVGGKGPFEKIIPARRIYKYKINACWQWDNLPVIPYKESVVLDCETREGSRRMFMVDAKKKSVKHETYFMTRTIPPMPEEPLPKGKGAKVFEEVWDAFDREYAMFVVKPGVDWKKLKKDYGSLAKKAKTYYELAAVIAAMLAHLEDLHVHVEVKGEYPWCYSRFRPLNASWKAVQKRADEMHCVNDPVSWGFIDKKFGYINVWGLNNVQVPFAFDEILEALKDTKGLILDLRFNGGGDETLAQAMAGRFADKERVYSLNQYRNGPKHKQLGRKLDRKFRPRGSWRYEAPVAVLCGQKTMSSAESFVLMMAQCPQAVLIGDRTAGSSANPRRLELDGNIKVNLPRWLDMDPKGNPIDAVGIQPDVQVKVGLKDFTDTEDPVLEAGIAYLKKPKKKRKK